MISGEKSWTFLFWNLRRACSGPFQKLRRPLSLMILAVHILQPRAKTDSLTLEHGIATGPVISATFQSAGPRAGILKLEECTVSVDASLDSIIFVFVFRQCLAMKTKGA
jgi:hypothetical protein